jgi:hypothetical protein
LRNSPMLHMAVLSSYHEGGTTGATGCETSSWLQRRLRWMKRPHALHIAV